MTEAQAWLATTGKELQVIPEFYALLYPANFFFPEKLTPARQKKIQQVYDVIEKMQTDAEAEFSRLIRDVQKGDILAFELGPDYAEIIDGMLGYDKELSTKSLGDMRYADWLQYYTTGTIERSAYSVYTQMLKEHYPRDIDALILSYILPPTRARLWPVPLNIPSAEEYEAPTPENIREVSTMFFSKLDLVDLFAWVNYYIKKRHVPVYPGDLIYFLSADVGIENTVFWTPTGFVPWHQVYGGEYFELPYSLTVDKQPTTLFYTNFWEEVNLDEKAITSIENVTRDLPPKVLATWTEEFVAVFKVVMSGRTFYILSNRVDTLPNLLELRREDHPIDAQAKNPHITLLSPFHPRKELTCEGCLYLLVTKGGI